MLVQFRKQQPLKLELPSRPASAAKRTLKAAQAKSLYGPPAAGRLLILSFVSIVPHYPGATNIFAPSLQLRRIIAE
jgi:hypothetical protein